MKDSWPSPTKILKDLSKRKPTKTLKESDVVLLKLILPNENETRQLQDIPPPELDACLSRFLLPVRKTSGDEYEPTTLREIIASVERYLKNLRYSEFTIEGQRSPVELLERHMSKRISQFTDNTVVQFVCRLRQRASSCDFAGFKDVIDHIWVNR